MKYGIKIIIWHECYVIGGADWSIIDILTNWPDKNCRFEFFVNKEHEGINLLKKSLNNKCKFNFYNSVIEKLNKLKKNKLFFIPIKINFVRKFIGFCLLIVSFFDYNKKIIEKKFDYVLINNGGYPGGLSSYLIIISAFLMKKKVCMIIRNYPPKNFKKSITMIMTRFIIEKFNCKIIAVSMSLKKSLVSEAGLTKSNISIIHNGISIRNKNKFRNTKKILIKRPSVGIFGRLEHRKGHHLLISSWKKIQKKIPNSYLYIVGNGDQDYIKKLKNLIRLNNLSNEHIIWIKYTDNILDILKYINLVIVPSINFESFGRVAVEAMALKKPIITSNFGGLKEININNKTGYVLNVNNTNLLSKKIIELMQNKSKRNLFGNMGYRIYQKNFTSKIMAKNYYNFVKKQMIH